MYLGVDGGGTKTAFCLLNNQGGVLARTRTKSIYYLMGSIGIVEPILRGGVAQVCMSAGVDARNLTYAFFGIPCFGEVSTDIAELEAIPGRILGHDRYGCGNDMVCGWAGSLGGCDGINVVSGTGSIAYGEFRSRRRRAGGWGEAFGDEGSAYWVAIQALNAFSRMCDGRLPAGPLVGRMRQALGISSDLDAVDVVLNQWHGDRSRIAALSYVLNQAAAEGDDVAVGVLCTAGRELSHLVEVVADRLGFESANTICVSHSGGMFDSPVVLESFRRQIDISDRNYHLQDPLLPPDIGAALYAAHLAGRRLDPVAVRCTYTQSRAFQEGQIW